MGAPLLYRQRDGLDTRIVDGEAFVITATTIQHLNGPAAAVWLSLEEPCRKRDVVAFISELYPDVPHHRINRDVQHILRNLQKLGLARGSKLQVDVRSSEVQACTPENDVGTVQ